MLGCGERNYVGATRIINSGEANYSSALSPFGERGTDVMQVCCTWNSHPDFTKVSVILQELSWDLEVGNDRLCQGVVSGFIANITCECNELSMRCSIITSGL